MNHTSRSSRLNLAQDATNLVHLDDLPSYGDLRFAALAMANVQDDATKNPEKYFNGLADSGGQSMALFAAASSFIARADARADGSSQPTLSRRGMSQFLTYVTQSLINSVACRQCITVNGPCLTERGLNGCCKRCALVQLDCSNERHYTARHYTSPYSSAKTKHGRPVLDLPRARVPRPEPTSNFSMGDSFISASAQSRGR